MKTLILIFLLSIPYLSAAGRHRINRHTRHKLSKEYRLMNNTKGRMFCK